MTSKRPPARTAPGDPDDPDDDFEDDDSDFEDDDGDQDDEDEDDDDEPDTWQVKGHKVRPRLDFASGGPLDFGW